MKQEARIAVVALPSADNVGHYFREVIKPSAIQLTNLE
jgi:hypothetical protein